MSTGRGRGRRSAERRSSMERGRQEVPSRNPEMFELSVLLWSCGPYSQSFYIVSKIQIITISAPGGNKLAESPPDLIR